MTTTRDGLRDDLLAVLAASRELPADHDSEVVDTLLDRWSQALDPAANTRSPALRAPRWLLPASELTAGALTALVGLLSLAHLREGWAIAISSGWAVRGTGFPQSIADGTNVFTVAMIPLLLALAVAAGVHSVRRSRSGFVVLALCTVVLVAVCGWGLMFSGEYVAYLVTMGVLYTWFAPIACGLTAALAVVALCAGAWSHGPPRAVFRHVTRSTTRTARRRSSSLTSS